MTTTTNKGVEHDWARGADWLTGGNANFRRLDAYALDQWAPNESTTTGLTYGYRAGATIAADGTVGEVAAGTVTLADATTNYVERTVAGVVSANAVGFTAGRLPMAKVTTAAGAITAVVDRRTFAATGATATGGTTITTQSGTSYTFVLGDANTQVSFSNASPVTATIPPNSSAAFPVGTTIELAQAGTGQVTVAAGSGVTLRVGASHTADSREQYAVVAVRKLATNEWVVFGNLAEAP